MNAKTVIFFCNWSTYPGLQFSQNVFKKYNSDNKKLVSMCSGRISPELILHSFKKGAWGVLITACPVDKCEHDGNYKTVGRVSLLKIMLQQLGVESERLKLEWIDKGEEVKLEKAISIFINEMNELGPLNSLKYNE